MSEQTDFPTDAEREAIKQAWHDAYEWQYDECDHGTYSGGPMHGQPYEMCRIQADRFLDTLAPLLEARLTTEPRLDVDDLRQRSQAAARRMEVMAADQTDPISRARLEGKAQGVRFAMSYLDDALNFAKAKTQTEQQQEETPDE